MASADQVRGSRERDKLTIAEVCADLGISRRTFYEWQAKGKAPRHACLSTWLNGGVYPTQVAEWAGHSVDVLLWIYAKCVVGQDELAKRRISEALRQD
jgi:predicted DNA-binding transcriptional regulator AlpA